MRDAVSSQMSTSAMESFPPGFFFPQSQMICYSGYPSEEYEVLTRDGYYVSLNRIPYGRENPRNRGMALFHKDASKKKTPNP